ncbi:MAG: hypothetical protein JWO15_3686 [Sphingomonadales bacterium]|nr:hypothetical protein [Sphingomonadales bacterium]
MTPNSQKIVHINYTSTEDGTVFTGPFTVKRFTVRDKTAVAVRKVQLNGGFHYEENGLGIDESTDSLNYMMAVVELGVIAAPDWWNVNTNYDGGLLAAIYREVQAFQNTFRTVKPAVQQQQGTGTVSQEGSSSPSQGTNGPGATPAVVGNEVLYSLEP